jgi:hypothetical protein
MKRSVGRPGYTWEDNMRMADMDCIHRALGTDQWWACEYGTEPLSSIKGGEFLI